MTDHQFRALLNLWMCSDPWPASEEDSETLFELIDAESTNRGYCDWIDAYHRFIPLSYSRTKQND